jgi:hypothetical protein
VLPYWLLFSVFTVGAMQAQGRPSDRTPKALIVAGLACALMIGVRFRVGGDWANYREMFVMYSFLDLWESLAFGDAGYSLVNWIAHVLGVGIWFVNLLCGLMFTWGLVRFAGTQPNPWLTCLVAVPYLIIVVAMGYTRQAVAIGFILLALVEFGDRRIGKFLFYMFIAVTFHKTAVVVLPLVVASVTKNRILLGALFIIATVLFYYFFLGASLSGFVTNYIDANYTSEGAAIRVAMNAVPAAAYLLLQKRLGLAEQERMIWRNFSLAAMACVAALWLVSSSTAVDRLALYLIPVQLVLLGRLPYIFQDSNRVGRLLVLVVVAYSGAVQFVWMNYATNATAWVPYQIYPIGDPFAAAR